MIEEKKYYDDQEEGWCAWCGETLPLYRHWRTTFCNKQCGNAYFNSLVAETRAAVRANLVCVSCGVSIQNAKRSFTKYCSPACRNMARTAPKGAFACDDTSLIGGR